MEYMLDYFVPADDKQGETNHHKYIRGRLEEPIQTRGDRDFPIEEIKHTIESLDHKKAPGEDGITSDILLRKFTTLSKFITLFNGCLRNGCFPKRWKRAKRVPIIKYGKENSLRVSKCRPISLINTGGTILEKALINRIMHRAYTNYHLNRNQYGFTPQTGSIDIVMEIKDFVEASLEAGRIAVLVSLYVRDAFDAACCPKY
jgi:hypothetical protein